MALVQPKRPAGGAFGIFLSEKRSEFAAACAGQSVSAVSKMAGASWANLKDAQRGPYQKKYGEVKAKYEKDMAEFLAGGGIKQKGAAAQRKEKRMEKEGKTKKKDPNAPKKPAGGGYGMFIAENRAKITKSLPAGHKMTDVGRAAGEQWRALSDVAKKPYEVKYQAKMAEYKAAMEAYKKTHGDDAAGEDDEGEEEEEASEEEHEKPAHPAPKKRARTAGA